MCIRDRSDAEAERRYLTFVRDRATAAAADGSLDATIRATAREVGAALGERGVEIWQRDAAAVAGAASRAALARAEVGVRRLLEPLNTPRAPVAASYSYSYSYSYDIIYDVSYSYSFETMAPTPAAVAAVSLNMGYTMAPLSASKSPAWVDFWASETYYGYMGDEEEMTTHAYTMVSVAFGADSVFGEVTTDSVGATIVIAEGPNPCVLGTSSSREEYDGCLETNGISGRRLDERERATPARASRRLVVASDDDIDEVCGPSCNVDDGSVTDDASKLVVGMEIETDLEAEEISAGVGAATDSVVAAATADCSCSETDMTNSDLLKASKFVVVKAGTSTVSHDDGTPSLPRLGAIVEAVSQLMRQGTKVILVSSGAVGCGRSVLRKQAALHRTLRDHMKSQEVTEGAGYSAAAAAAGQLALMSLYETLFATQEIEPSQFLVTRRDFVDEACRKNLQHSIQAIMDVGMVPIINENDAVSGNAGYSEVPAGCFSDNDGLAALVAKLVGAEPDKDLAVLHIDTSSKGKPLVPLTIGSSHSLRVGQKVSKGRSRCLASRRFPC